MRWIDNGWAAFIEDATEFSEAFREQMSLQLMQQFNTIIGKENAVKKRGFMLHVGMNKMNIHYREGKRWISIEVIGPDSFAREVSAYWYSDSLNTFVDLTKSNELNADNIHFGFGADLDPLAYQRYFAMPKLNKKKHQLTFDVQYDFSVYPDLSLAFYFDQEVNEDALKQIHEILMRHMPTAYISSLGPDDDHYTGIIDFQGVKLKDGKAAVIAAMTELSASRLAQSVNLVRIQ